ncbi:MAG: transcription-repair coupling factor [Paludibacteraceae bacterium]|nr:transcription-repair coupling factor [Paludibacteraceae bacterium]
MELIDFYKNYLKTTDLSDIFKRKKSISFSGLHHTSVCGFLLSKLFEQTNRNIIFICEEEEVALYNYNDIAKLIGEKALFFPSSYKNDNQFSKILQENVILRTEVLNRLAKGEKSLIVGTTDSLMELVPTMNEINSKTLTLSVGEEIDIEFVIDSLFEYGFQQVDFVYQPGQFSLRGSIVDVFSFTNDYPYRIDFFDDKIDSIRVFDIEKQLSLNKIEHISILSDIQNEKDVKKVPFFSLLPNDSVLIFQNRTRTLQRIEQVLVETENSEHLFVQKKDFLNLISNLFSIDFVKDNADLNFSIAPQPLFHKNFDLVADKLLLLQDDGFKIFIASDSEKQTDRIAAIFAEREDKIQFTPIKTTIHQGFIDQDNRICCFTDHQIFERFHKFSLKTDHTRNAKAAIMIKELNQIKIGDFIVHTDHGIGQFGGLLKTDINGKQQEVIKLIYKNNDIVLVSIHSLHRISKYRGKDGETPQINKLGTGAWKRMKERTKSKVKDIARDLIALYAKRLSEKGFAFSPDSYLQNELEASFIYEDTPDQLKVTAEVKQDMEKLIPMDRLIYGDVGFGKTEIAIRAAFKAATDGKQVAVLVPTTVLAFQHYKTFTERLKNLPCRIEYVSRMRKASDVKQILKDTAEGKIEILIGTHRIIGKDVQFNDLGLLIIDEEQKFGVAVKEKLKQLKSNVDTLTLTATPIPRTLQFSLMGARDLSVITTPPPNRYPISTEIIDFNEDIIKEVIEREMNRNGQVFFIHNRIQSIEKYASILKRILPNVRIGIAHGQLPPEKLEEVLLDFIDYEYDVLIATTVIESGIDIPNVNTIIVNKAQSFGLTDLHQLRGRVGRSNKKAYCYLIAPAMKDLTLDAQRRLKALESFSDLGSGFNIAMQDLDIRGAGNMLGAEQSGFIADIGYETYQKILEEAVEELKNEEFADLYQETKKEFVTDCVIESDLELMFPVYYIENVAERMSLYRTLDNMKNEQELSIFERDIEDRFGKIPLESRNLIQMIRLRWLAQQLGFERLVMKNEKLIAYLVPETNKAYYQSEVFGNILRYIVQNPKGCHLRENDGKRSFVIQKITSVQQAYDILQKMKEG